MIRPIKPEVVVPYLEALGVRTVKMESLEAVAVLKSRDELVNHVGSLHAAVVFGVAECASGAILTKNFDIDVYTPLLKSVTITYKAQIFGSAEAKATIDEEALQKAHKELEDLGRTDLEVHVKVYNSEVLAADLTFIWALRKFIPSADHR